MPASLTVEDPSASDMLPPVPVSPSLTSRSVIQKSILWALLGRVLPLSLAVFTIPLIIKGLGTENFGILTLVWLVIGYANLFDFGLGRALTQLISQKIGSNDTKNLPELVWTTTVLLTLFGVIAATVLFFTAPVITQQLLKVSPANSAETIVSIRLLAGCLPIFFASSAFGGVLAAYQLFKLSTLLNLPMLVLNFIGPLLIFPFSHSLSLVMLMLVLGRVITLVTNMWASKRVIPNLFEQIRFNPGYIKQLFSFGGWMTVSNVISPLMVSFDRFLIANLMTAAVVAYYTTPFEVVSKLLIIPGCVTSVMFPAFSAELATNPARAKSMFYKITMAIAASMAIPVLGVVLFAPQGFTLWINAAFSAKAAMVAQVLAVGIFINALAYIPFTLIQAKGKPDITAKCHLLEFPLYALLIWFMVQQFGLIGAAWAWVIRVSLDACLLFFYTYKKIW